MAGKITHDVHHKVQFQVFVAKRRLAPDAVLLATGIGRSVRQPKTSFFHSANMWTSAYVFVI